MANQLFANNKAATIAEFVSPAQTTIRLYDNPFPVPTGSQWFYATITAGGIAFNEIVKVTAITDNVLTVERGQDDTGAQFWPLGARIEMRINAETLRRFDNGGSLGEEISNEVDYTQGAALVGFDGVNLAEFFKDRCQRVVNSIADLEALDVSKYTQAFVTGYYSDTPGVGGGPYKYVAESAATPNGGDIIAAAGGVGAWHLQTQTVGVSQFGARSGGSDSTARAQAFLDRLIVLKRGVWDVVDVRVTHLDINNAQGCVLESTGSITGSTTGTYESVLTIRNSVDFTVEGRLPISGNYNENYDCGVAIYTDNATACSKLYLSNIIFAAVKLGFKIGRLTEPNALISEIVVGFGNYTYDVPAVISAIGTQTVVNVVSSQVISEGQAGGPPGWELLPRIPVQTIGAQVNVQGGEVMLSVTTGITFDIQPIADPVTGNSFGTINLNGVEVETGSQLAVIRNPSAIGTITPRRGGFIMTNCRGVHTQNLAVWIDVQSSLFSGDIKVDMTNRFFCTTTRTFANINAGNAHVWADDGAFGDGFVQGLGGTVGGVLHFDYRMIFEARNGNSTSVPSQAAPSTIVNYVNVTTTPDTARFVTAYSAGRFTVPAGGLKDMAIQGNVTFTALTANPVGVDIYKNGALFRRYTITTNASFGGGLIPCGDAAAGDIFDIRVTQTSGSTRNPDGGSLDGFVIYARN